MEEIIEVNGERYKIKASEKLTSEQRKEIMKNLSPGTCTPTSVVQNTTKTLTGSVTGGVPPFTYKWLITHVDIGTTTLYGQSINYTFSKLGTYYLSLVVTDSCSTGAQEASKSCSIDVTAPVCTSISCNFTIT